MVDIQSFIDRARSALRTAYSAAAGNDALRQDLSDLNDHLTDIEAEIDLQNLLDQAAVLNQLSDVLDTAIGNIEHNTSNYLLDDLLALKKDVATAAGVTNDPLHLGKAFDGPAPPVPTAAPPPAPPVLPPPNGQALVTLFNTCVIKPDSATIASQIVDRIVANSDRYRAVELATNVPWWFVAIIHSLESSGNFSTHLHNGDSLSARTVHVPVGRPPAGDPPFTWEDSAADALRYERLAGLKSWTLPEVLQRLELYNGPGYANRNVPSPYLWSGSNQYVKGKYTSDGVYDPNAVSSQIGGAVLLKIMADRNLVGIIPATTAVVAVPIASVGNVALISIDVSPFPHAAKEIDFPGELKLADTGEYVRRIQEWCIYHGFPTGVDGDFGSATQTCIKAFQKTKSLPDTGVVDEQTWILLTAPMRRAIAQITRGTRSIYDGTLAAAAQHLKEAPIEIGGQNCGPWVRLYMEGNQGADQPWCAGFVCFLIQQAARDLKIPMPISRQVGVDQLVQDAKTQNRFIAEAVVSDPVVRRSKLTPGCLFVRRSSAGDTNWVHTGLLTAADDAVFHTVEGNTNDDGSSDGYEAIARTRAYPKTDFVLIV